VLPPYMVDIPQVRADMANTPEAWQQEGFSVPFEQRERVLAQALTYQQYLDRSKQENDQAGGSGKGSNRGGLKAADENAIHKYTQDMFKGIYNPATGQFMGFKKDTSRQQAAKIGAEASRIVANNPQITLHEAVMQASKDNGVDIVPVKGKNGGKVSGKDPLGLR
jgi:hypothetical protein